MTLAHFVFAAFILICLYGVYWMIMSAKKEMAAVRLLDEQMDEIFDDYDNRRISLEECLQRLRLIFQEYNHNR